MITVVRPPWAVAHRLACRGRLVRSTERTRAYTLLLLQQAIVRYIPMHFFFSRSFVSLVSFSFMLSWVLFARLTAVSSDAGTRPLLPQLALVQGVAEKCLLPNLQFLEDNLGGTLRILGN
jgi:hypothetical protein